MEFAFLVRWRSHRLSWSAYSVQTLPGAPSTTSQRDLSALGIHCSDVALFVVLLPLPLLSSIDFVSSTCELDWMVSVAALAFDQLGLCNWRSHNRLFRAYLCSRRFVYWRKCFRVRHCYRGPSACYPHSFPIAYHFHVACSAFRYRRCRGHSFPWIRNKFSINLIVCHIVLAKQCTLQMFKAYLPSMRSRNYCEAKDHYPFQLLMQSNRKCLKFRVAYDDHHYPMFDRRMNP